MKHLTDEKLIDAYYEPGDSHLAVCPACRDRFEQIKLTLDSCNDYAVPARPSSYGAEVWAQVAPHLAAPKQIRWRWWILAPVFASLLVIAFWAGRWTREPDTGFSARTRDRVLLMAISDHLERSQIVLTELSHAGPGDASSFSSERDRARELVDENRLLRESARRAGDSANAALLDDLERLLVDITNSPEKVSDEKLRTIQARLEDGDLLFKVRISASDARKKGQRL